MRDPDTGNSKGYAFINFASFEAADMAIEAMNGQYLCNRAIAISYAFKKDSKGERHGSAAGEVFTGHCCSSSLDQLCSCDKSKNIWMIHSVTKLVVFHHETVPHVLVIWKQLLFSQKSLSTDIISFIYENAVWSSWNYFHLVKEFQWVSLFRKVNKTLCSWCRFIQDVLHSSFPFCCWSHKNSSGKQNGCCFMQ